MDLSLFAFDNALVLNALLTSHRDKPDTVIGVPSAVFKLAEDREGFSRILKTFNPDVSAHRIDDVRSLLFEHQNEIAKYELGASDDFDELSSERMREIVSNVFRMKHDAVSEALIDYFFQVWCRFRRSHDQGDCRVCFVRSRQSQNVASQVVGTLRTLPPRSCKRR